MKDTNNTHVAVILGAVMEFSMALQLWRFPLVMSADRYVARLVLGEWRIQAAALLAKDFSTMLVTGGSDEHPVTGQKVSRAEEMAKAIRWHLVNNDTTEVIPIGTLTASHTQGNVANTKAYLEEHPEVKSITIVSPGFQLTRAALMFALDPFFAKRGITLKFMEVEKILLEAKRLTQQEVDLIYDSPEHVICKALEDEGCRKLLLGDYTPATYATS